MFGKKRNELSQRINELSKSQELLYKSTRLALDQYGKDIRAIIDVLIKKKIIKINKKTLKQSKVLFGRGEKAKVM